MTRPELLDQIAVMLGGRAAEELVYRDAISTGAANDLERASELARQMVTRFGMSDRLGQLTYGHPLAARFLDAPFAAEERNYSEQTAEIIDAEVRRIIDENYQRVCDILANRRPALDRISSELIRHETLDRTEIEKLV